MLTGGAAMMLTATGNFAQPTIVEAGVIALLGYGVVFFGLVLLMLVIMTMSRFFVVRSKKESAPAPTPAAAPVEIAPIPAPENQTPAPGSAGQLKLHDVPPKTAAILMAIVAHQLGKPLNELRFISIKEVK